VVSHRPGYALAAFGRRVRQLREAKGLTQMKAAAAAGVTVTTVMRMEAGRIAPRIDTVMAVASALGGRIELVEDEE
jgi:transcriptional regulator with XRE-family HTH domain